MFECGWNASKTSMIVHFSTFPAHHRPVDPHGHYVPQLWREGCYAVVKGSLLLAFLGKCLLSKKGRIRASHLFASRHAVPISHKEAEWLVYQTKIKAPSQTPHHLPPAATCVWAFLWMGETAPLPTAGWDRATINAIPHKSFWMGLSFLWKSGKSLK